MAIFVAVPKCCGGPTDGFSRGIELFVHAGKFGTGNGRYTRLFGVSNT